MRRSRGTALVVAILSLAALVAGCGRDDFDNEPRPPVAAEVSIELGTDAVIVSPAAFGAGLVNFTIANLGDTPAAIEIDGPTVARSDEIPPGGTTQLKTEVVTGDYEATADGADIAPFEFEVGPERPSAQDELLLP
jgi:hypothetical protein